MKTYHNSLAFDQRFRRALDMNLESEKRKYIIQRGAMLMREYFDDFTINTILTNWSELYTLPINYLRSLVYKPNAKASQTELLQDFLASFQIRQNAISKQVIIERDSKYFTIEELEIMAEDEGLNPKKIRTILNPLNRNITVVRSFNPLEKFFRQLADNYRGEKLIEELAGCLPVYDFGMKDKTKHYNQRAEYYLSKWLSKAAGQALNVAVNDAMLLWIEPTGGSGKSRLNNWLFSLPEFQEYYIVIRENESFMDFKGLSSQKFVMDWDELPISKKRYLTFKSNIAQEGGQQYDKKTKSYVNYKREVNWIGSTNKANRKNQNGYLLEDDSAMMRRIIPVELEGRINYHKYTKDIDLKQLWGQAATNIILAKERHNTNFLTWQTDWDDLRSENSKYIARGVKERIDSEQILNIFKPAPDKTGRIVTSSEMLSEAKKQGLNINLSESSLGRLLATKGYTKARGRYTRGWYVN